MSNYEGLAAQLDSRRVKVGQATDIGAGVYRFSNYFAVDNPGEALQPMPFPVVFTEKPCYSWGAEVADGSKVASGNFPVAVAMVATWHARRNEDTGTLWYLGCTIAVVSSGTDLQTLLIGCHFEGRAPRQPMAPTL